MLPNKIIEDLWDGIDYEEPLSVLQTQISRLRHVFSFEKCNIQPFFAINYIDGYYLFQLNEKCTVDYKEMELYINKQNLSYDKKQTLELGYKIINLYKDEYLTELGNAQWLIPVRSRYNRLFVKSLYIHLHLLSEMLMDNEIIYDLFFNGFGVK